MKLANLSIKIKQLALKLFLVGVFVPLAVKALNLVTIKWFHSSIFSLTNFTLGLLLSYLILTLYDKVFVHNDAKLLRTITENQDDIRQVRYELLEIKEVLADKGLIEDANELALVATIKKDIKLKEESGDDDKLL